MIFDRNKRLSEIFVRSKEIKEIKESYQIHAICVVYIIFFFYLNTLSIRFSNEEKEEMCTDFLIGFGIKNLRTFPYKVKK